MEFDKMPAAQVVLAFARLVDEALASSGIENARRAVADADSKRRARTALEQLDGRDSFDRTA
ncbi:MAG TPA: hypothetical protein VNP73_00830 [Actinomycetota bacterium]|nr:hypothetical protein [Actinomycetota bacterium]